ncbi:hypothetical protein O1L44_24620 [Streptomyces noursei]|nr:hypothetical protein [Streptomyces noursei]
MTRFHQLIGAAGSTALDATYAAYYASIAQADEGRDGTVRHRLRPEVGDGTIEVTSLRSGFHIVRYDVAFVGGHQVGYTFLVTTSSWSTASTDACRSARPTPAPAPCTPARCR